MSPPIESGVILRLLEPKSLPKRQLKCHPGLPLGLGGLPAVPIPCPVEHSVVSSEPNDVDAVGTMASRGWHADEDAAQSFPLEHFSQLFLSCEVPEYMESEYSFCSP